MAVCVAPPWILRAVRRAVVENQRPAVTMPVAVVTASQSLVSAAPQRRTHQHVLVAAPGDHTAPPSAAAAILPRARRMRGAWRLLWSPSRLL